MVLQKYTHLDLDDFFQMIFPTQYKWSNAKTTSPQGWKRF